MLRESICRRFYIKCEAILMTMAHGSEAPHLYELSFFSEIGPKAGRHAQTLTRQRGDKPCTFTICPSYLQFHLGLIVDYERVYVRSILIPSLTLGY